MANAPSVNEQNFHEEVLESSLPVLVDFWAPWCGYCTRLAPILDEIAAEMPDKVRVVKVNVDENRAVAAKYEVMSLPTLLLFKKGEVAEKLIGYMPKASLSAKITPHLG